MKFLSIAVLSLMVSTSACSKTTPVAEKTLPAVEVVAKAEPATPESAKACVTQKDAKTGKEKEVCKVIKIHKKLDGAAIPTKK